MVKSGIIFAALAFLLATGATLLSPVCSPCVVILLGLLSGYLAGVFDRPGDNAAAVRGGATAGGIGAIGAVLGQLMGAGFNALLVGPSGSLEMMNDLGLGVVDTQVATASYYGGVIGSAICLSIVNLMIFVGLGAVGGLLWWQISGKNSASETVEIGSTI